MTHIRTINTERRVDARFKPDIEELKKQL